jgi:predicted DCC family thiol-disulfide oxidoreductase YuxK
MIATEKTSQLGQFEVFYDGDCPLCKREIDWLRKKDRQQLIQFTDIAADDFDPDPLGRSHDELMARIHGRMPDGTVIEGVEVFRQLYSRIGFGRAVGFSRLPVIKTALEASYRVFAKLRLPVTGRLGWGRCSQSDCAVKQSGCQVNKSIR